MSYSEPDDYIDDSVLNKAMIDYINKIKKMQNSNEKPPEPTELRVSTRSSKGEISAYVNMVNLINFLVKKIYEENIGINGDDNLLLGVKMKKFIYSSLEKDVKEIKKKRKKKKKKKEVGKNYFLRSFYVCIYVNREGDLKRVIYDESKENYFYDLDLDVSLDKKYSAMSMDGIPTFIDNDGIGNVYKDCPVNEEFERDRLLKKYIEYRKSDWEYINNGLELLNSEKREHFYNSCTIILKPDKERRPVNVKLFCNGQITITGGLQNKDGMDAVNRLLGYLRNDNKNFLNNEELDDETYERFTKNKKCGDKVNGYLEPEHIDIIKYDITMINSDFKLNFNVNRDKLYELIRSDIKMRCVFDDSIYPGVKIYYYWNLFNKDNNGICQCSNKKKCNGKGNGLGDNKCKKVTVVVFQSGSVMITGANSDHQIQHVHKDILKIINDNYTKIIKFSIKDHILLCDDEPPDESYIEEEKKVDKKKSVKKVKGTKKVKSKIKDKTLKKDKTSKKEKKDKKIKLKKPTNNEYF
jgi:hypothetical protein